MTPTAETRTRARRIDRELTRLYPEARCSLDHADAFQLLVATILSAQCTDARVNLVTPALFARFPDAAALAAADQGELERLIHSTGFYQSKAKNLIRCAAALVEHGGRVPSRMDQLVELAGVGRKTANVIRGNAFGIPGLPVDTHVTRLARRMGLTEHDDAVKIETDLTALIPKTRWTGFGLRMIYHGRAVCDARKPDCDRCPLRRGRVPGSESRVDMERLLERFCRYARIDSQADERSTTYPSTPGQLEVGRLLVRELHAMGIADAAQDEHGIVMATVPANVPGAPVIAWVAHVDTSPETSGKGVKPVVHRDYDGNDIVLPGDTTKVIRAADNPDLVKLKGKTIITTDGTTLLGGDDKAGVAAIMEAAQRLIEDPSLPRGPVRLCFTCDEEIGHGVDHVDLAKLGASVAYTLDGSGTGEIDTETFGADLALVTIHGTNIHPALAKGRMVNAVRLAGLFLDRLPRMTQSPETTDGRDGFLHPYVIEGGVAKTTIKVLLRDFDTPRLREREELLRLVGRTIEAEFPTARVEVVVTPQYRNMADGLEEELRAIPHAVEAMRRAGIEPRLTIVRGGTDGSRLTEIGLPTPNLSTGEHNFHSPLEWTCLEEMDAAARVLIELAAVWSNERS